MPRDYGPFSLHFVAPCVAILSCPGKMVVSDDDSLRTSNLILCLLFVLMVAVEAQNGVVDLPALGSFEAPCAHLQGVVYGNSIRASVKGSLITFQPLKAGTKDEYDPEVMVLFQVGFLYEARPRPFKLPRPQTDPIVRLLNMTDCQCSLNEVHHIEPGFAEEGYQLVIKDCPSDPPFVATISATTSNATKVTTHNNTMQGSIVKSFNYTHTCVFLRDQPTPIGFFFGRCFRRLGTKCQT